MQYELCDVIELPNLIWVCPSHHSPNDMTSLLINNTCSWLGNLNHQLINELVLEAY